MLCPTLPFISNESFVALQEFLAATINMSKLQRDDRLKAAFSHFDIDSNGFITREELLKSLQSLGVNEQGVDDIIADVDKGV